MKVFKDTVRSTYGRAMAMFTITPVFSYISQMNLACCF